MSGRSLVVADASSALILLGVVKSTKDPDGLGRVQVDIPGLGTPVTLPWLRLVQPAASKEFGMVVLPEVDDEVVVLRGLGWEPEGMLVLGAVYNGKRKPKTTDADGKNNVKEWTTRAGHALRFTDKSGAEAIELVSGDGKLTLKLDQKGGAVQITGDKSVAIKSNTKVTVEGSEIEIKGSSKVTITGSSQVELTGNSQVKITGQQVQISGMVDLG